ncbi:[acyl-carrier-protein] S-malonyltransferase [Bowdeniella nasicola]|uniref:[acyl-carrier-protein] S-malonyltransferase n=1 Tax=Bowdeniella nasicola TaxID=208480 RepID=A0A1H3W750_9ACTO|nr:ACP S-malonyltransferase [Bowdeniella nasicola]SDZ82820.1 [acyl-carrier-protein] S-malonyltransferase [Bowdeniella nasicola]
MLAVLCPGQGSQRPGMLTQWLEFADESDFTAASHIEAWSQAADLDLVELGSHADDETLRDTKNAQPLIVALSILSWRIAQARGARIPQVVAGHSVGEIAALAIAGVISDGDAVRLAAIRGRAMAQAAAENETTMAAIVGGKRPEVLAALDAHDVTPANINGSTQVVAAGSTEAITALGENLPRGARLIPLSVAGAFHTHYMADAVPAVRNAVENLVVSNPNCTLLSNHDGAALHAGSQAVWRIVQQMTSPVRWDLCQEQLISEGVTHAIELAPAGVLAGLARRDLKGVATLALAPDNVADLPGFLGQEDNA